MPRERGWRPDLAARIDLDEARLAAFCKRWRVACLELFGSVVRRDFHAGSDVDVLVTFCPEADWSLLDHARMEEELSALFGRPVDLLTRRSVERAANPLRRASILANAVPLYPVGASSTTVTTAGGAHDEA
jgi:predicted nucleotidyltransferase